MKNLVKHSTEFLDGYYLFILWCRHSEGRSYKTFEDTRGEKGASVYLSVLFLLETLHR